jgi:hypothetical protein
VNWPVVVALLRNRASPPNLMVCLPFVQLSVSPYVQTGDLSIDVIVIAPPAQVFGGRPPEIGLQTLIPWAMSEGLGSR